jgi:hypothetical protein
MWLLIYLRSYVCLCIYIKTYIDTSLCVNLFMVNISEYKYAHAIIYIHGYMCIYIYV